MKLNIDDKKSRGDVVEFIAQKLKKIEKSLYKINENIKIKDNKVIRDV